MNQYAIINILGWVLAILFGIFCILSAKRKLEPKIIKIIWTIFGIAAISYGVYILSVKEILGEVFPHKHYSIGGWIAISIGIIFVITVLWNLRKDKKRKES
jgi:uncharacterized membrane protein